MAADDIDVLKQRFNNEFSKLIAVKGPNCGFMNRVQYKNFIDSVKQAKSAKSKTPIQYRRIKRFDICSAAGVEKLITPSTSNETNTKFFVANEDMFEIIHEAHLSLGHAGRDKVIKEISKHYKNITQEVVSIYLKLCVTCQKKCKSAKKETEFVLKPIVQHELDRNRCHVDLIDMQSNPDGPYNFILVYQDQLSKFVQLRALKSKTTTEVATTLLDIFCTFGAPMILDSGEDEFFKQVLEELASMWHEFKLLFGKTCDSGCEQQVEKILSSWLQQNNTNSWSEGLKFVQMIKNRAYCDGSRTPFKAMFGVDCKIGLFESKLSKEFVEEISTEEELFEII